VVVVLAAELSAETLLLDMPVMVGMGAQTVSQPEARKIMAVAVADTG
jgi:hypothetical protein